MPRVLILLAVLFLAVLPARAATDADLRAWLEATVWPDAARAGVSRATFEAALPEIRILRNLPDLAGGGGGGQAEFSSPGRYFDEGQIAALARIGRDRLTKWSAVLDQVERRYGVPRAIIAAVWARESNYGAAEIPHSALSVLATQALLGTRKALFYPELIAALQILEADHLPATLLKSSWAGALGQPQFMPSKFLAHAVDFDGDGRPDIWSSVPDTLASIANYLAEAGWNRAVSWGEEVSVPGEVACSLEGPEQGRPLRDWAGGGLAPQAGRFAGSAGDRRFLLMPAGRLGPAFLVTENFYVLKRYNESDLYALFVGHLADRMTGGAPIAGRWGRVERLTRADVRRMQQGLIERGHDVGGADGLVGFRTRVAIGRHQAASGLDVTCMPGRELRLGE